MPSLSVEQIDRRIRDHERQISELRALRAGILRYAENGNGNSIQRFPRLAPNTTGLKAAILALNLPSRFSVDDVTSGLKTKGFDFAARNPKDAVRDCLYVLAKKKRGIRRGGDNLYEKTSP